MRIDVIRWPHSYIRELASLTLGTAMLENEAMARWSVVSRSSESPRFATPVRSCQLCET